MGTGQGCFQVSGSLGLGFRGWEEGLSLRGSFLGGLGLQREGGAVEWGVL